MNTLLIENVKVYQDHHFVDGPVLILNGKFEKIGPAALKAVEKLSAEGLGEIPVLDGEGKRLIPGFIDPHTHGAAGVDVNGAGAEGLRKIAAFFASQGTTGWLASVLTDTKEQTMKAIADILEVMKDEGKGAQLMGVHLEGPFLSHEYKGAMPDFLLQKGDPDLFFEYQKAAEGAVKYITVSPEVENCQDLISAISHDTVVAIGHSGATYEEAMAAIDNGARCITHTFNAMKLFHQHFPAIMGAALESDAYCEAICDGRHLAPATVRMLLKCKGWDRVIGITDSIMAAGLPDGNYKLGVNDVVVVDGDAKLLDGTRAGSTLTTGQAFKNLMKFTQHPMEDVIPILTENTAAALRMSDRKGRIKAGLDADCLLVNDEGDVLTTIVGGNIVYEKETSLA